MFPSFVARISACTLLTVAALSTTSLAQRGEMGPRPADGFRNGRSSIDMTGNRGGGHHDRGGRGNDRGHDRGNDRRHDHGSDWGRSRSNFSFSFGTSSYNNSSYTSVSFGSGWRNDDCRTSYRPIYTPVCRPTYRPICPPVAVCPPVYVRPVCPPPVVYVPQPRPIYVETPVYVAPAPVYYAPSTPVVVAPAQPTVVIRDRVVVERAPTAPQQIERVTDDGTIRYQNQAAPATGSDLPPSVAPSSNSSRPAAVTTTRVANVHSNLAPVWSSRQAAAQTNTQNVELGLTQVEKDRLASAKSK